jgi:hypothetical protein
MQENVIEIENNLALLRTPYPSNYCKRTPKTRETIPFNLSCVDAASMADKMESMSLV